MDLDTRARRFLSGSWGGWTGEGEGREGREVCTNKVLLYSADRGGSVSLSTIVLYGVSLASVVVSSHLHCYDSEAMATDVAGA